MAQTPSYAEVIQLAIDNEQNAADLYAGMAERAEHPGAKAQFEQLANMERGHKMKLETMDLAFFESRDARGR